MNFSLDSLAVLVITTLYTMEKSDAEKWLNELLAIDKNLYAGVLNIAKYGCTKAAPFVKSTATQIDDTALASILDAITTSATANGITL